MRVWTRQHRSVLEELSARGRYAARRSGVYADLQEQAPLVLTVYDWLAEHHPLRAQRMVLGQPVIHRQHERRLLLQIRIYAAAARGIAPPRRKLLQHAAVLPCPHAHIPRPLFLHPTMPERGSQDARKKGRPIAGRPFSSAIFQSST